jgi:ADP-heptose:LPS heptosyltransferase
MKVTMHGQGHVSERPKRVMREVVPTRIAAFRRGGLGDGLLESCLLTAARRQFQHASIDGFSDDSFFELLRKHPACSTVIHVPWGRGLALETDIRRQHAQSYDLWYDTKPVPMIDGRMALTHCDLDVRARLADVESRYYHFNADEIISLYRDMGCRGQMEMMTRLFGFEVRIQDAYILRLPLPSNIRLPSSYITVSAGFTHTSEYKSWPAGGWEIFGGWLNSCGICPIQVGSPSERRLEGFLSMTNLSMNQQFEIISGAMCHIGSDGFLCHVSSALDTPTVVLWGPTPSCVWGHVGQIDVVAPDARNLWWTHYHWGRSVECKEMMARIDPGVVCDVVERHFNENDKISTSFFSIKTPCVAAQVQGGFGDGLMAMAKLKSSISPGKKIFVIVVPDGNGNVGNAKKCCEMFSFVDDVIVEMGPVLDFTAARNVIEKWGDGKLRMDEFLDLRYGEIMSIKSSFSKLSTSDLKFNPSLPEWLPSGDVCCIQPATRDHKDENAAWPDYWKTVDMIEDVIGIPVILIGGGSDIQHITKEPSRGVNAVGKLSFEESFALVATSKIGVSMDSWVAHCAGAFGNTSVYIRQDSTLEEFLEFVRINGGDIMSLTDSPEDICDSIRRGIIRRSR